MRSGRRWISAHVARRSTDLADRGRAGVISGGGMATPGQIPCMARVWGGQADVRRIPGGLLDGAGESRVGDWKVDVTS